MAITCAWFVVAGFRPEDLGTYGAMLPPVGGALRLKVKGWTASAPK